MLSTITFWIMATAILGIWIWLLIDFAIDVKNGYLGGEHDEQ